MQFRVTEEISVLHRIACDRCGKEAERGEVGFQHMTSIGFDAPYESIFGDGNRVNVDLCETCLRITLGSWLRVVPSRETNLSIKLSAFNPDIHT